jgi:hypothetical protein
LIIIAGLLLTFLYDSNARAGTATLSWNAPTTNADGSPLTDLAGYKVYYGSVSIAYTQTVDVGMTGSPSAPSYVINNLADGNTYYFAVTAYDSSGNESGYSGEVSKAFSVSVITTTTSTKTKNTPTTTTIRPNHHNSQTSDHNHGIHDRTDNLNYNIYHNHYPTHNHNHNDYTDDHDNSYINDHNASNNDDYHFNDHDNANFSGYDATRYLCYRRNQYHRYRSRHRMVHR